MRREEFVNKAELYVDISKSKIRFKPDISIFMTDFTSTIESDNVVFEYDSDSLNRRKYKHLRFYLKNVGNADINSLDICVTSQRSTMLCGIDEVDFIVKNKFINYNFCYDRKILKGDTILVDIAFLKSSKIFHTFSCELAVLFTDSYNNMYRQPFFINGVGKLYEPTRISSKQYKIQTTTYKAEKCFKHPWLW